ncbi:MAG: type III-A CRISPR-associated protein Csm2 [Gammaproteobacteria bacterium]|jgi:CRISPR-associated protein Csm2|nr:type III-A CRISPR-associated protein Csm2 [Gammaproteobacteria bacterium]|tara:strand:- start:7187 stop:7600 length:414 start_codon:yes stop_codon:yes gene_type:complete
MQIKKFWKDKDKKQIEPDLFSEKAEELAKKIDDEGKGDKKTNKPSQIRKFFDEVLRFDSMLKANPSDFDNMLPYIKMLNAKAAYAEGRGLISRGFREFISSSLNLVRDKDDFNAFAGLFEAFIGYYKFYRRSEGGGR